MWNKSIKKETNNFQKVSSGDLREALEYTMTDQLQQQIAELSQKVNELTVQLNQQKPKVEEYKDVTVTVTQAENVSLQIYKSLPEFNGTREKYATWRTSTKTAMNLLSEHKTQMRYFEALMIVRNKVTGTASNILNNYNTAFNFEAIIDRLDFTYADKRPLYVLEQELLILQQHELTIDEFYDRVNEKLNVIVNKINMTYKEVQFKRERKGN